MQHGYTRAPGNKATNTQDDRALVTGPKGHNQINQARWRAKAFASYPAASCDILRDTACLRRAPSSWKVRHRFKVPNGTYYYGLRPEHHTLRPRYYLPVVRRRRIHETDDGLSTAGSCPGYPKTMHIGCSHALPPRRFVSRSLRHGFISPSCPTGSQHRIEAPGAAGNPACKSFGMDGSQPRAFYESLNGALAQNVNSTGSGRRTLKDSEKMAIASKRAWPGIEPGTSSKCREALRRNHTTRPPGR